MQQLIRVSPAPTSPVRRRLPRFVVWALCLLVFWAFAVPLSAAGDIAMVSTSFLGHLVPLLRLADELQRRGHRVRFMAFEEARRFVSEVGVEFLSAGDNPMPRGALIERLYTVSRETSSFRAILAVFNDLYLPLSRALLQGLLARVQEDPPELFVMDVGAVAAYPLAKLSNASLVLNSPTLMFDIGGAFRSGAVPAYLPAWGTGFSRTMGLWDRCMNVLFPRLLSVALTPSFMMLNKFQWEHGLPQYEAQDRVFEHTRVLHNLMPELDHARKESPLVLTTGPILPRWAVDKLAGGAAPSPDAALLGRLTRPEDEVLFELPPIMSQWFRNDSSVVYVDMGHMPKLDTKMIEIIANGFKSTSHNPSFQVFWLVHESQRKLLPFPLPNHVLAKVHGSIPHLKILSHPSVKVVFSHCGGQAVGEALAFGKPLVCLPFFIDQNDLAARIKDAGAGLVLNKMDVSPLGIFQSLEQILHDPSFAEAARRSQWKHRFRDGLTVATEEIERILVHGSDHLEPIGESMPWKQYSMVDVYFLLSALVSLALVLMYGMSVIGFGWTMLFARFFFSDLPVIEFMRDQGLAGFVGVLRWETQRIDEDSKIRSKEAEADSPLQDGEALGDWPGMAPSMDKACELHGEIAALERSHMSKMGVIEEDNGEESYVVGNSDPSEPPGFAAIMTSVAVVDAAVTAMSEQKGSESRRIAEQLRDRLKEFTLDRRRKQELVSFRRAKEDDAEGRS